MAAAFAPSTGTPACSLFAAFAGVPLEGCSRLVRLYNDFSEVARVESELPKAISMTEAAAQLFLNDKCRIRAGPVAAYMIVLFSTAKA